jgi:hypothetical protein
MGPGLPMSNGSSNKLRMSEKDFLRKFEAWIRKNDNVWNDKDTNHFWWVHNFIGALCDWDPIFMEEIQAIAKRNKYRKVCITK